MAASYPETPAAPTTPEQPRPEAVIRRAARADAAAVAGLGRRTFAEAFGGLYRPEDLAAFLAEAHSKSTAQALLADPAQAVWLAEAGGEAVAYALAGPCALPHPEVTATCGELKRLYVAAQWQNGGLGARLFEAALAWLYADGPRTVWIGVWSENHGAQRFYARSGFEMVGEYDFLVGAARDREFIFRRRLDRFSAGRHEQD
jgi:GNAT superfamily N-acetyltransferase